MAKTQQDSSRRITKSTHPLWIQLQGQVHQTDAGVSRSGMCVKFLLAMSKEKQEVNNILGTERLPLEITSEDKEAFQKATACYTCGRLDKWGA